MGQKGQSYYGQGGEFCLAKRVKVEWLFQGMLEYCVMLLLRKESCYASDIIARLKAAELIVVEGTLYPLLTRLKNDGLLSYEWRESTQGPPRKYYLLTESGAAFLEQLDSAWASLVATVNLIKS